MGFRGLSWSLMGLPLVSHGCHLGLPWIFVDFHESPMGFHESHVVSYGSRVGFQGLTLVYQGPPVGLHGPLIVF